MKRLALLLLVAVLLASCGLFKNVSKTKHKLKVDSLSESQSGFHLVDTGHTIITELADTTLQTPEQTVQTLLAMDIYKPFSVIIDTGRVRLEVNYDPATRRLQAKATAKAQTQIVQVKKVITQQKGLTIDGKKSGKVQLHKIETKTSKKTSPNRGFLWIAFVIAFLIVIAVFVYFYFKR
jgi:hypothetical protein